VIGRFSKLGVYQELFRLRDFYLAFNAFAVLAGGMGWLTPIMAAIVHNVGSVLVVFASASFAIFPQNTKAG
jgi:Cd2+/Zn2+-exporting ATPase